MKADTYMPNKIHDLSLFIDFEKFPLFSLYFPEVFKKAALFQAFQGLTEP